MIVIAVTAQMTLKGLLAPARLAFLNWSVQTPPAVSLSKLLSDAGFGTGWGQLLAVAVVCGPLLYFALATDACAHSAGLLAAGAAIGLLVGAGWFATGYLGDDDFNPAPVASLTFVAPVADTLQYAMLSTGLQLSFGIVLVTGIVIGSLIVVAGDPPLSARRLHLGAPHAALAHGRGADGGGRRDGLRLHGRAGPDGLSTLALPSFIAVAGYLGGAWAGLRGPIRVPALTPARHAGGSRELTERRTDAWRIVLRRARLALDVEAPVEIVVDRLHQRLDLAVEEVVGARHHLLLDHDALLGLELVDQRR